jgi:hypothetical protein
MISAVDPHLHVMMTAAAGVTLLVVDATMSMTVATLHATMIVMVVVATATTALVSPVMTTPLPVAWIVMHQAVAMIATLVRTAALQGSRDTPAMPSVSLVTPELPLLSLPSPLLAARAVAEEVMVGIVMIPAMTAATGGKSMCCG